LYIHKQTDADTIYNVIIFNSVWV